MRLFDALLRRLIRKGRLVVTDADGRRYVYGDGEGDSPAVAIRFTDRSTPRREAIGHTFSPARIFCLNSAICEIA